MTDLDFDELDKAVSSLMGGVQGDKEKSKEPKTLKINTTLSDDEQPEYEKIEAVAKKIGSEAIEDPQEHTAILPDSTRKSARSVRFMDVMHKSSAVKGSGTVRSKTTIDESGAKVLTLSGSTEPTDDEPKADAKIEPVPAVETLDVSAASEPKDVGESNDDAVAVKRPKPAAKDAAKEDDLTDETKVAEASDEPESDKPDDDLKAKIVDEFKADDDESDDVDEPLTTPFIADAQVEKRPLGGGAAQSAETGAKSKRTKPVVEEAPEEFSDALLAVETSEASVTGRDKAAKNAIFDMDEYHKPIEKQAQGNSPWLWVVMVLVILVLGGLAGIVAFMLIG